MPNIPWLVFYLEFSAVDVLKPSSLRAKIALSGKPGSKYYLQGRASGGYPVIGSAKTYLGSRSFLLLLRGEFGRRQLGAPRAPRHLLDLHPDPQLVELVPGEGFGTHPFRQIANAYPVSMRKQRAGDTPTDYLYTGQREEAEVGLYYYVARFYDPALGRFIQADTLIPYLLILQWNRVSIIIIIGFKGGKTY